MNDQFIQGIIFDWNKIDDDSYLKQIEALKNIERLEFKNSINFFVGDRRKELADKVAMSGMNFHCIKSRLTGLPTKQYHPFH